MECPNCKRQMKELEELSRGMGNQSFKECPHCGTVALCSGEVLTQSWTPTNGQEGGDKCPLVYPTYSTHEAKYSNAEPIKT